jgi:hypothetical protein
MDLNETVALRAMAELQISIHRREPANLHTLRPFVLITFAPNSIRHTGAVQDMLLADAATDDIAALLQTAKEACAKAAQLCAPNCWQCKASLAATSTGQLAGTKDCATPKAMTSWRTYTLQDYSRRKLRSRHVSIARRKFVLAHAHRSLERLGTAVRTLPWAWAMICVCRCLVFDSGFSRQAHRLCIPCVDRPAALRAQQLYQKCSKIQPT